MKKWLGARMTKPIRKLGRPRGPQFTKYQVTLDEESGEWAKAQPEGLSAIIRRLLRDERIRQGALTEISLPKVGK